MSEMPEGGAELERVQWCAPLRGLAVGHQPRQGLVPLLARQRRAELDDRLNLGRSLIALGVTDPGRHDDRLSRSGHAFLAVESEPGFARGDDEPLLLVRVAVLGDHTARHTAPVEADQLPAGVLGDSRDFDPLAGSGVEEGPECGHASIILKTPPWVSL